MQNYQLQIPELIFSQQFKKLQAQKMEQKLLNLLEKYWNYASFRPGQEEIVRAVLNQKDVLAVLPTGGGKSLCYQLPALAVQGTALVVSPLIALMNDQVYALRHRKIPAAMLHSGMNSTETEEVLDALYRGELKLLYISPERLQQQAFQISLQEVDWSFLVVDEAHCISEWGHDFRPLYRKISSAKELAHFKNTIALTASATPATQNDICSQLRLNAPLKYIQSIYRRNISYEVRKPEHKLSAVLEIAAPETQIIYCPTRRMTEEISTYLRQNHKDAVAFHAGLPSAHKKQIQENWTQSSSQIMAATNAFGMGIDKPNVRKVIHFTAPFSLEAYYQEAGRAGRDGLPATAVLLVQDKDQERLWEQFEQKFPAFDFIKNVYDAVCRFLQIGHGEGFEQLYYLDLQKFVQSFKLPMIETLSAIKLLEQNGYWHWEHDNSCKDNVRFTCNRSQLEDLADYHPELSELAQNLLRIYGGIFHFDTRIDIAQIASFSSTTYEKIKEKLFGLHRAGIINYTPAQRGSSLFFLEQRIPLHSLQLDRKHLAFLKQRAKAQTLAMTAFMDNESECRSTVIARYFGEKNNQTCKICDICRRKEQVKHFGIKELVHFLKNKKEIDLADLVENFKKQCHRDDLLQMLHKLSIEGLVQIQGSNVIFAQ